MRAALLVALFALVACVAAAPNAGVCTKDVQLELRPSPTARGLYQLAFVTLDQTMQNNKADFIDIHYRVNNENAVNLRVLTEQAITDKNQRAKQAKVDGIQLDAGDVLRAYATYSTQGIACDTAIYSYNAPELQEWARPMTGSGRFAQFQQLDDMQPQWMTQAAAPINTRRTIRTIDEQWIQPENVRRTTGQVQQVRMTRREAQLQNIANQRLARTYDNDAAISEQQFWTAAAAEAEQNNAAGVCPAIAMDQDIALIAGLRDTYVLTFENKQPAKQLHYVDLHLTTDADAGWDNLRLGSDMQLSLAHKVMQPGVVIKPNEQLSFYWSYRATSLDGVTVDCTTPITTVSPQMITHQVDLNQLKVQ